jgi:hypothetical protein
VSNYPNGTNARLIEIAAAEVGTIEEGDNLTKYGKFTGLTVNRGVGLLLIGVQIKLVSKCTALLVQLLAHINLKKQTVGHICPA